MHKTQRTSLKLSAGALLISVGLAVCLCGCKGQPRRGPMTNNDPVNTGLGSVGDDGGLSLPEDDELMGRDPDFGSVSDQIAESARQLNVYFANMEIDGVEEVDPASRQRIPLVRDDGSPDESMPRMDETQAKATPESDDPIRTEPVSKPPEDGSTVRVSLLGGGGGSDELDEPAEQEESAETPVPAKAAKAGVDEATDPLVRKEELARELAVILKSLAATSDDPGLAALALAGLETLLPEDSNSEIDEGVLSDAEQASLDAVRSLIRSMSSGGAIASPSEILSELEAIQGQLNAWAGLRIKKSALCTQVDGYGRYETFPAYRFIAGRSQPAIVYVELERFGQREFIGPDGQARYETKLSQRLELYHVADDLNTWNRAAETVTDVTRNHLRDYYLINQITLPANLGVGRYHLKVVMRDLIADKVAEAIIPIEIVAR